MILLHTHANFWGHRARRSEVAAQKPKKMEKIVLEIYNRDTGRKLVWGKHKNPKIGKRRDFQGKP